MDGRRADRGVGRIGGGDLSVPVVDPKNPDIVITANTVSYKSTDARQDLGAVQGRARRRRLSERLDQPERSEHHPARERSGRGRDAERRRSRGAPGTTSRPRSSITSTPTTTFPYRVCSGQQESGSACVSSRGNDGQITFREWHPVARRGIRLRRARSEGSEHRVRRQGHALRPAHDAERERQSDGRRPRRRARAPGRRAARGAHAAGRVLARRSAHRCSTATTCCGRRSTAASTGSRSVPN